MVTFARQHLWGYSGGHPRSSPRSRAPRVLAGERACPPEDCGGSSGYANLLETIANPKAKGHAGRLKWFEDMVPDGYDHEVYPLDEVNEVLSVGLDALVDQFADDDDWDLDDEDEEDDPKVIQFPHGDPKRR
jgi:hypothetical protein